jgi:aspartate 1-decarboxylase
MVIILIFLLKYLSAINIEKFQSFSQYTLNSNTTIVQSVEDILFHSLNNNPRSLKTYLPKFEKIFTKRNFVCDFPFIYNSKLYQDSCVQFPNGKFYCKINQYSLNELTNLSNQYYCSTKPEFFYFINDNNEESIFDECLSYDQTENYLSELIENNNYDYQKNHLMLLYSKVKYVIENTHIEKLVLLYELTENYCKTNRFDLVCLYDNLFLPISRTEGLFQINLSIQQLFDSYKNEIKDYIVSLADDNRKLTIYEFIKEENLSFDKFLNDLNNVTNNNFTILNGFQDNYVQKFKSFLSLLKQTYNICVEECKNILENIFIESFGDKANRIKQEIISYLFHLKELPINKDNEFEINEYILNQNRTVNFKDKTYPLTERLELFLNYKEWSMRYLLGIIYKYLLIGNSFYNDIILDEFPDEKLNKLLFYPKEINDLDKSKLLKNVPLVSDYQNFTTTMINLYLKIYSQAFNIEKLVYNFALNKSEAVEKLTNIIEKLNTELREINSYLISKADKFIEFIKSNEVASMVLDKKIDEQNSVLKQIMDNSKIYLLEYINKQIYDLEYFVQECSSFVQLQTFYENSTFATPQVDFLPIFNSSSFEYHFDREINYFKIFISLRMGKEIKRMNFTIHTDAFINIFTDGVELKAIEIINKNNTERIYTYQLLGDKMPNFIKIDGQFDKNKTAKYIKFESKYSKNSTQTKTFNVAINKCNESNKIELCFDESNFNIDCEIGCGYLSAKRNTREQNRKHNSNAFLETCEQYCKVFPINVYVYKCIKRNIFQSDFFALLYKCGGIGWDLKARLVNHTEAIKLESENIFTGESFYIDYSKIQHVLKYTSYIESNLFSAIGALNFILKFDINKISEVLITTGDLKFFTSLRKEDLFIKGYPYIPTTKFNYKHLSQVFRNDTNLNEISIFNLLFNDNGEDLLSIYADKYIDGGMNTLLYSDSMLRANTSLDHNGRNIFVRSNLTCLSSAPIYNNMLKGYEYTVEPIIFKPFIYTYIDSMFIAYKLPEVLNNTILLRSKPYQSKYWLNVIRSCRVYIALEINNDTEHNARALLQDNWRFVEGNGNVIELLTNDISEDLLHNGDKYCEKVLKQDCQDKDIFESSSNKIKMNLFFKDFNIEDIIKLDFSFFDFDDLKSSLHLLLMKSNDCENNRTIAHNNTSEGQNLSNINNAQVNVTSLNKTSVLQISNIEEVKNFTKQNNTDEALCETKNNTDINLNNQLYEEIEQLTMISNITISNRTESVRLGADINNETLLLINKIDSID